MRRTEPRLTEGESVAAAEMSQILVDCRRAVEPLALQTISNLQAVFRGRRCVRALACAQL